MLCVKRLSWGEITIAVWDRGGSASASIALSVFKNGAENDKINGMEFDLSKHAQEELTKRKIPLQVLELILNHPSQIIEEDKLTIYQGLFTGNNGKNYLLRVFLNTTVKPVKVIRVCLKSSCFWCSKAKGKRQKARGKR